MINFKSICAKIGCISLIAFFTQCGSANLDKSPPVEVSDPYFQKWVAGVEGGGKGFIVVIPINGEITMRLKTAYFQGKKLPLVYQADLNRYEGKYTDPDSVKKDLTMSDDPVEEFQNTLSQSQEYIPFELQEGECIVSYMKSGKPGFFKIYDLEEKDILAMPSAPPRKQ